MTYVFFFLLLAFAIGCAVSSFFGKRKNEQYYWFRTYQLYKEGRVDRMTVIIASFINTILGVIILAIIGFKFFLNWATGLSH
jgi:hypothetical protein